MIFQVFTLQEFSRVMLLQVGLGAKNPRGITLMLACVSARNYIFRKMKNLISLAIDQEFGRLSTICQITFTLANFNLLVLFVFFSSYSGILSQDSYEKFAKYGKSYIASSYVKYIESAGARVVPIRYPYQR